MTRRKRIVFGLIAMSLAAGVPLAAVLAADVYLHRKVERFAGVNVWGYRGPRVPRLKPGEHRIVVLGGSTAFGYGVNWNEAFPAQLEARLRPLARQGAPVSVVNLGMNSQGVYSFKFTLEDYLSLGYETAIFYEGYNDHAGAVAPNYYVARRDSPIFRLTGYYPIFPVIFREKAMMLRSGGDLNAAYRGGQTVFRPSLAARTSATALEAAARIGQTLDEQLNRVARSSATRGEGVTIRVPDAGCPADWSHYCGSIWDAIQFALAHGKKVLVVTQPYIPGKHRSQQDALRAMLAAKYAGNPNVGYADFGELIDVDDPAACYDHMHLTVEGNGVIAAHLVGPVAALMPEAFERPR